MNYEHEVDRFKKTMVEKLLAHEHENPYGWKHDRDIQLYLRFLEEVGELTEAIRRGGDSLPLTEIPLRCANAANFLMMIHNNVLDQVEFEHEL